MDKEIENIKEEINKMPIPKQVLLITKYSIDKIKEKILSPFKNITGFLSSTVEPLSIILLASVPSLYIYNRDTYLENDPSS